MEKPLILVTNDDGHFAPGIKALVEAVSKFGTPVVVAPDSPQSGQGHAITITKPLRLNKINTFGDVEAYECSGTPADCVKLAKHIVLKNRKIDLCVSGINHGSNASLNIIYSGTMSAAMEASIENIPSIGFSLCEFSYSADFSAAKNVVDKIVHQALLGGIKPGQLLNVNIPYLKSDEIKGIKICKQGKAMWQEGFQEGEDPRGIKYYWLKGEFVEGDQPNDSDLWALQNGFVSVVPSHHDLTKYADIEELKDFELNVNDTLSI